MEKKTPVNKLGEILVSAGTKLIGVKSTWWVYAPKRPKSLDK